jgi:hypothetical protein
MAEKGENLNVTRSQRTYAKRNGIQSEKQNGENIQTQAQEIPVVQNTELTKKVEGPPSHEVVDCLTCCEPINYFSISKCGHTSICSMCVIRMRVLFDELECPLCKVQLDDVIFTANPNVVYSDISANKNKMIYDRRCKAYFEDSKFEREIQKLWELKCPKCSSVHNTMNGLSAHIKASHNLSYCQICLEHQKVFFCEKVLYTPEELNAHNKNGDNIRKIKPHPSCDFCHKVFFSEDDLYYHCRDNHFTCFICDRQNMKHHYFKDYQHLEKHFKSKHFFCTDSHCVASRFVAFSSSFELQAHNVSVHFQTMTREQQQAARTVEVNFTIRRGDSDRNRPSTSTAPPTRNVSSPVANGGYNREDGSICFNPDDFMDNKPMISPSTSTNNVITNNTNNNNNNSNNNQVRLNGSGNITPEERAERNVALKNKILIFFDGDQKLLAEIMKKTKNYLDGLISAAEFHTEIVHTFGDSENSRQIYDELVFLFPKKNKKERDEILNYRQKLSQTQNLFPSLSETATIPVVVPITPVVAPQGTNYKNSIGASNSKQIVDSAFPTLPVSKKEPASEPKPPVVNLPSSANSYQPGSGRGFPIHSQPKPKPTPQQQTQVKQQQQQQQQKQTKPKPSYDASTAPVPVQQPKKSEQPNQNKPTPKPSYAASTAPIPKQAKPKDQQNKAVGAVPKQQEQQNQNKAANPSNSTPIIRTYRTIQDQQAAQKQQQEAVGVPKQQEQQNQKKVANPPKQQTEPQNKAVAAVPKQQEQKAANPPTPKPSYDASTAPIPKQTEQQNQQNKAVAAVPKQKEQNQNKAVQKQEQEVPDIPPHLQQQENQSKSLSKQEEVLYIPLHLKQPKQQEQNQSKPIPKQEEVPDIPPHLQQPKQQESHNKSGTSVPIGNSHQQQSGGAGRGKKKQQKQVMMSWG